MSSIRGMSGLLLMAGGIGLGLASPSAQTELPATRMVNVEGRMMRVRAVIVRLHIKKQAEWALGSTNGLFVLAGHSGHQVHRTSKGC
jgi:hypothetical protein